MIKSIISLVLLLVSAYLSFSHGWGSFNYKNNPESLKMMNSLGINESIIPAMGIAMMIIGVLMLIPRTFFLGNLLSAIAILIIMALAIKTGNYKMAMIEIPFLILPLVMIWLKYPFKN